MRYNSLMETNEQIANLKKRVFILRTQHFKEPENDYLYFMVSFLKKQIKKIEEGEV
jgi:hypothetical protein